MRNQQDTLTMGQMKQVADQIFKLYQLLDWTYSKIYLTGCTPEEEKILDEISKVLGTRKLEFINKQTVRYELMKKPTLFPQSELLSSHADFATALKSYDWYRANKNYDLKLEFITRVTLKENNGTS